MPGHGVDQLEMNRCRPRAQPRAKLQTGVAQFSRVPSAFSSKRRPLDEGPGFVAEFRNRVALS